MGMRPLRPRRQHSRPLPAADVADTRRAEQLFDAEEHDLGHDVRLRWDEDELGFVWRHPGCRAWMPLRLWPDPKSTGHQLIAGGPADMASLTIEGSLLCPACGQAHGHIRRGRWVPC